MHNEFGPEDLKRFIVWARAISSNGIASGPQDGLSILKWDFKVSPEETRTWKKGKKLPEKVVEKFQEAKKLVDQSLSILGKDLDFLQKLSAPQASHVAELLEKSASKLTLHVLVLLGVANFGFYNEVPDEKTPKAFLEKVSKDVNELNSTLRMSRSLRKP